MTIYCGPPAGPADRVAFGSPVGRAPAAVPAERVPPGGPADGNPGRGRRALGHMFHRPRLKCCRMQPPLRQTQPHCSHLLNGSGFVQDQHLGTAPPKLIVVWPAGSSPSASSSPACTFNR